MLNKNRTITYQEIENKIWYDSEMSDNALRILIKKLRKKLPSGVLENIVSKSLSKNTSSYDALEHYDLSKDLFTTLSLKLILNQDKVKDTDSI